MTGNGGSARTGRPPSVDALARSLSPTGLPHPILVEIARDAIARGAPDVHAHAAELAAEFARTLLGPVINATGVLLHTNLGRAPFAPKRAGGPDRPLNLELDLDTGERGSHQRGVGRLLATLVGAEAALVVNNNAAAVLLVLSALAAGRDVPVSRGESVEIGGGFRVPEVMQQSGARLVDVGTTNRTRLADYRAALASPGNDVALVLKVHPSNYRVEGFVETVTVAELATLAVPVVADIGSGLIDAACPWLDGGPPAFLRGEPAARQTLADGAALVTFSGDKLFGGPQAGVIAGRADLVDLCARHPLARALRPGAIVLAGLQEVALSYLGRDAGSELAFWRMVTAGEAELRERAERIVAQAGVGEVTATEALPGAGSAPGATLASFGVCLAGDHLGALRCRPVPVIARVHDDRTLLDVRSVDPADDALLVEALRTIASAPNAP